ncbi:MAG: SpoIIE family protein phosphatase [Vicinamibacterales bacterium]
MRPARLEFADAAGKQQAVSVDHTPFRIGRSHSNNLTLQAAEVSREHAEIIWDGHQFQLLDRESRAGTFVNDDPVTERRLASGDRIRLGPNFEIVFAIEEGDPDDTASTSASSTAITDLRQTALLLEALSALGSTRVLEHVLDLVLDSAIDVAGAERGFIMLVSPSGKLEFKAGRRRDRVSLAGGQFQTSQKIPEDVFRTGQTRLVEDLLEPAVAPDHDHTIALGIREVLCAPLKMVQFVELGEAPEEERRIGVLYLDSRERKSFRSTSMRAALETLANEAAVAIENARLYRESQDKASLEQDLRTAYEFQQALLPKAAPALGYFDAAALMVPCRMIGGDFFEYVTLDEGAFGFTLGDVAGKGAPAGLLGARIQEIFSAHAPLLVDPASTVDQINTTLLRRSLESRFVTMFYGILYRDGRLRFCNGGHNPPILIAADGVRRLQTGGLIVGLFDDAVFEEETQQMAPGDLLVVFSDGITEATNDQGEEFGDDRIIECVCDAGAARDPDAVLTRVFDRLKQFTVDELQGDDMTALVLRYTGSSG